MKDGKELIRGGKYNHRTYEWVMLNDVGYCKWVMDNVNCGPLEHFAKWLTNNGQSFSYLLKK